MFHTKELTTNELLSKQFEVLKKAMEDNFVALIGTSAGDDSTKNACGVSFGHAYSVHGAFTMTDGGTTHDLIMIRNPWGTSGYSKEWHSGDSRWTAETVAKVPLGIDPRTSDKAKGVFIMPKENLKICFEELTIGHVLPGYTDNWYDALDMDEEWHTYFVIPPAKNGNLIITVESYSSGIIPGKCVKGTSKTDGAAITSPEITMTTYKGVEKKWVIA